MNYLELDWDELFSIINTLGVPGYILYDLGYLGTYYIPGYMLCTLGVPGYMLNTLGYPGTCYIV